MANLVIERVLNSGFEFTLDGGVTIFDGFPNMTSFDNICHFKTRNGANIVAKQNIDASEVTVIDTFGNTGSYNFNNVSELRNLLVSINFFRGVGFVSGSGVNRFDELVDTFKYIGNNKKAVVVDEAEQKLITEIFYNYSKLIELDDVSIKNLIKDKVLGTRLIDGVTKFTLIDKPTDGTTYFSAVGGFDYDDLETKTTPLNYTTGELKLTNDTLGTNTFLEQSPFGITSVWDESINSFDFSQLSEGDQVFLRVNIDHTTTVANQVSGLKLKFSLGNDVFFYVDIDTDIENKQAGTHNITKLQDFYVRDEWKNNPVDLIYISDDESSIVVNGWHPYIIRKSINILDVKVTGSSEKQPFFEATEGQTQFNIDASADNIDIWVGGVYKVEAQDYVRDLGVITMQYPLKAGNRVSHRTYTSESTKETFTASQDQTDFSLSSICRSVEVHVNGRYQIEEQDYTITDNIVTFTYNLKQNNIVTVRKFR